MITQRLITLSFLIIFIDANRIDENFQQNKIRQRRSLDLINLESAYILFQQLHLNDDDDDDGSLKRSETPSKYQSIEGPVNIEQLPAVLASRNIKRYPYSQQNDPAIIG